MNVSLGTTLLLDNPYNTNPAHAWVVVTEPIKDPGKVLIVNLTSYNEKFSDPTVVLTKEEHPFLDHKSCVRYIDARWASPDQLEKFIEAGVADPLGDCPPATLEKIRNGILNSPETEPEIKEICADHF